MPRRFSKTITLRLPKAHYDTASRIAARDPSLPFHPALRGDLHHLTISDVLRLAIHLGLDRLRGTPLNPTPTKRSKST